ncbi:MAG: hypothetical protein K9N06_11000 [Candidatus Cloacimonetes bacterium]|nr:hypothetical protein [Candidatus Cloacimonadota bacterium]
MLLIFSRSSFSMADLNDKLLALPIDLECAQHLEGGPEASFYLKFNDVTLQSMGSYETDFNEKDSNDIFMPLPNVIGIIKKTE